MRATHRRRSAVQAFGFQAAVTWVGPPVSNLEHRTLKQPSQEHSGRQEALPARLHGVDDRGVVLLVSGAQVAPAGHVQGPSIRDHRERAGHVVSGHPDQLTGGRPNPASCEVSKPFKLPLPVARSTSKGTGKGSVGTWCLSPRPRTDSSPREPTGGMEMKGR